MQAYLENVLRFYRSATCFPVCGGRGRRPSHFTCTCKSGISCCRYLPHALTYCRDFLTISANGENNRRVSFEAAQWPRARRPCHAQ
jgi:hypothetical protein